MDASTGTTDPPAGGVGRWAADDLLRRGTVTSVPATPIPAPDRSGPFVLAVDIGGTKMEVGIVDGDGRILVRERTATPVSTDPERIFAALRRTVTDVLAASPVPPSTCGVGCGGPMAAGGEDVSPLNIHGWRRFPLRARLADLVGVDVAVDNDAKALALGEGWTGAARGAADYLALVVSTGVGGGVVLDGRLLDGSGGNAGHIGHVVVEPDGRPCACGGRGCLEAEVSGTAIAAVTGRPAAEAGTVVRQRCGTLVGRAVASVANLLDLQLAVVAGSVALGFGDDFFDAAQEEIGRRCGLEYARPRGSVPAAWVLTVPWSARPPSLSTAPVWWPVPAWWRMVGDEYVGPRIAARNTDEPGVVSRTGSGGSRADGSQGTRAGGSGTPAEGPGYRRPGIGRAHAPGPVVDRPGRAPAHGPAPVVALATPPAAPGPAALGVPHDHRLRPARRRAGPGRRRLVPRVVPGGLGLGVDTPGRARVAAGRWIVRHGQEVRRLPPSRPRWAVPRRSGRRCRPHGGPSS